MQVGNTWLCNIVQIERRPGRRFVSEALEIFGYDTEADKYDTRPVYMGLDRLRAQTMVESC